MKKQCEVPSSIRQGAMIPAYLTLPENYQDGKEKKLVIFLHGHGGNHNETGGYDMISNSIAEKGMIAATLDFPGCGDSKESFLLNTLSNMKQDVLDVVSYLKENYSIGSVNAMGYSMGGRILLELIAEEKLSPEKAVFMAPAARIEDVRLFLFETDEKADAAEKKAFQDGSATGVSFGAEQELSKEWFQDMEVYGDDMPQKAASVFHGQALVIYASDDVVVRPETSQAVADTFHCRAVVLNGCGHAYSFYADDPEVVKTVNGTAVDFLTDDE